LQTGDKSLAETVTDHRRRRRVDPELALTGTFLTRARVEDIKRWQADAELRGITFSAWVRLALDEAPRRFPPNPRREPSVAGPRGREKDAVVDAGRETAVPSGRFEHLREQARTMAVREGKCTADVSRGTRCKLCGEVH